MQTVMNRSTSNYVNINSRKTSKEMIIGPLGKEVIILLYHQ